MFDLILLIKTAGYLGIGGIIFSESGLLFGLLFPGDSLLFTAGFLASQGFLNIWILSIVAFMSAVLGDSFGYWFGKNIGVKIFSRQKSHFLSKDHLIKAEDFFVKHGPKALVLARFIPIVRTLVPILAGVGKMNYRVFLTYNLIGAFLWVVGVSFLGYFLGNIIPNVDNYLLPIIILIILLSILPNLIHLIRNKIKK